MESDTENPRCAILCYVLLVFLLFFKKNHARHAAGDEKLGRNFSPDKTDTLKSENSEPD